jgi:hypothetical protein
VHARGGGLGRLWERASIELSKGSGSDWTGGDRARVGGNGSQGAARTGGNQAPAGRAGGNQAPAGSCGVRRDGRRALSGRRRQQSAGEDRRRKNKCNRRMGCAHDLNAPRTAGQKSQRKKIERKQIRGKGRERRGCFGTDRVMIGWVLNIIWYPRYYIYTPIYMLIILQIYMINSKFIKNKHQPPWATAGKAYRSGPRRPHLQPP